MLKCSSERQVRAPQSLSVVVPMHCPFPGFGEATHKRTPHGTDSSKQVVYYDDKGKQKRPSTRDSVKTTTAQAVNCEALKRTARQRQKPHAGYGIAEEQAEPFRGLRRVELMHHAVIHGGAPRPGCGAPSLGHAPGNIGILHSDGSSLLYNAIEASVPIDAAMFMNPC